MSRASEAIERLLDIMARLRAPDGCPWDLEQTLETLRPYVLEETYEVLEALDAGDAAAHREELGDLLLQIVFQARLREEAGLFAFADVADAISDKLVSRHPHVFAGGQVKDAEGVLKQWAALKREEKRRKGGGLSALAASCLIVTHLGVSPSSQMAIVDILGNRGDHKRHRDRN